MFGSSRPQALPRFSAPAKTNGLTKYLPTCLNFLAVGLCFDWIASYERAGGPLLNTIRLALLSEVMLLKYALHLRQYPNPPAFYRFSYPHTYLVRRILRL